MWSDLHLEEIALLRFLMVREVLNEFPLIEYTLTTVHDTVDVTCGGCRLRQTLHRLLLMWSADRVGVTYLSRTRATASLRYFFRSAQNNGDGIVVPNS